jgi:hypothetical protein
MLCVLGFVDVSFAEAIRTSLMYSVLFSFPKILAKLLALLVAVALSFGFVEAGITRLAVYGKVDLIID